MQYTRKRMVYEIKYNKGSSVKFYKHYSVNEKIDYYSKRINDDKLTDNQRKYAEKKVYMLASGIGRIYLVTDDQLGNKEYGSESKIRRVIPTAINEKNQNVLINAIYSRKSDFNKFKLSNYDDEGFIPILNHESYLNVQAKKKTDNTFFNLAELEETTSTVNPFDLDNIINYVYPRKQKTSIVKHNHYLKRHLKK